MFCVSDPPPSPRGQNFFASVTGSQKNGMLTDEDGNLNYEGVILDAIDTFFTSIFTLELVINMFANWFTAFFSDGWNQVICRIYILYTWILYTWI